MWRPSPGLRDTEKEPPSSLIALFASVSNAGATSAVIEREKEAFMSADQLLRHPSALLAMVPDGVGSFRRRSHLRGRCQVCHRAPRPRQAAHAGYHTRQSFLFIFLISCKFPALQSKRKSFSYGLGISIFLLISMNEFFNRHTFLFQTHGLRVMQGTGKTPFGFIDVSTSMMLHPVIPVVSCLYSLCIHVFFHGCT